MNYNPGSDSTRTLKQRYARTVTRMKSLTDVMDQRKLTPAERDEFASLKRQGDEIYHAIKTKKLAKRGSGSGRTDPVTGRKYKEVRGVPNEQLTPEHSFADYVRATSDVGRSEPKGIDWDAYWAAKIRGYENAE